MTLLAGGDMVELRLDTLRPAPRPTEIAVLLAAFDLPVLATCRSRAEGGAWAGDEDERVAVLRACLVAGAEFVDVELDAASCEEILAIDSGRVVVSKHWLEPPTPAEIDATVHTLLELRPGVAKIVVAADRADESAAVLRATATLRQAGISTVGFGMGGESAAGRLLAAACGDAWIYARAPRGTVTAEGQWSGARLQGQLDLPRWRSRHARFAVVGDPVRQSLSPAIFNAAFAAAGREAIYMPLPARRFGEVLRLAEQCGVAGLSVTMPFKRDALAVAGVATDSARRMGAANTLRFVDGDWHAHNTDGEGVLRALDPHVEVRGVRTAVLGAGGAARAAAVALADAGAEVTLYARDYTQVAAVAADIGCAGTALTGYQAGEAEVVINATPVGMLATDETPIPTTDLVGGELVLDMIYRPKVTRFLRAARQRGCVVVSGLEMFLGQAVAQHEWWFKEEPVAGVMRHAAELQLESERERA